MGLHQIQISKVRGLSATSILLLQGLAVISTSVIGSNHLTSHPPSEAVTLPTSKLILSF